MWYTLGEMFLRTGVVCSVVALAGLGHSGCLPEPTSNSSDAAPGAVDAAGPLAVDAGENLLADAKVGQPDAMAPADAAPGPVAIFVQDTVAHETNRHPVTLLFRVVLNKPATAPVTVRYATEDVDAAAGEDYVAQSGTLVFSVGQAVRTVEVQVTADRVPEPDERVVLALSDPDGAVLGRASGVGTIADDDRGFDFDGDGYADLLVGAPGAQEQGRGEGSGAAYVFFGPVTGQQSAAVAQIAVVGSLAGHSLGRRVAGGDINGDGVSDFVVGVRDHDATGAGAGAALVFYGERGVRPAPAAGDSRVVWDEEDADVVLRGAGAGDHFGVSVATADINGDGVRDLVIGARAAKPLGVTSGATYIYLGGPSLPSQLAAADADQIIAGPAGSEQFGNPAANAGDVNGDGFEDLVIGAQDASSVYLFYGSSTPAAELGVGDAAVTIRSPHSDSVFGICARGAGDINGDGLDDVVIGAPANTNDVLGDGSAFVFYGSVSLPAELTIADASVTVHGHTVSRLGFDVAGAGDVNGDGFDDLLFGERLSGNISAGAAYLWFGADDLAGEHNISEAPVRIDGDEYDLYLGTHVTGRTDLNGDGRHDVMVGGPFNGGSRPGIGKLLIFLGRDDWPTAPQSPATADAVRTGRVVGDAFGAADHR